MGQVTLTTPICFFVIPSLILDMSYLCINLATLASALSRDMILTTKLKIGHVTVTTPIRR